MRRFQAGFIIPAIVLLLASGCQTEREFTTDSSDAVAAYNEGVRNWELFYYAEAKESFHRSIAADSQFALAWGRLALVENNLREGKASQAHINRAHELASGASRREQLMIRMWQESIFYRLDASARTADSLIAEYPHEREGYLQRGQMYELQKQPEQAVGLYLRAVEIDTGFARGFMMLGYAYSNLNQQEKALASMQRYVGLAPDAADPRASYADLLLRVGRYDEALEQYRAALELKPDYFYPYGEIAGLYRALGRLREARDMFRTALTNLPATPQMEARGLWFDGLLETARGKYPEAAGLFRSAVALDTASLESALALAGTFARLGTFSDAHAVMEQVHASLERRELTKSGYMVGYHMMRANILRREGRTGEAREACSAALEFSVPLNRPAVFLQIARVAADRKEWEDALDAIDEALSINRNHPEALLALTRIHHEMGDRAMTREVGIRLRDLWKDADPDFQDRKELLKLLGRVGA